MCPNACNLIKSFVFLKKLFLSPYVIRDTYISNLRWDPTQHEIGSSKHPPDTQHETQASPFPRYTHECPVLRTCGRPVGLLPIDTLLHAIHVHLAPCAQVSPIHVYGGVARVTCHLPHVAQLIRPLILPNCGKADHQCTSGKQTGYLHSKKLFSNISYMTIF